MARSSVLQKIARQMLAVEGVPAVWRLHLDAATLYGVGNPVSAAVFLEIADIAAEEWQNSATVEEHRIA